MLKLKDCSRRILGAICSMSERRSFGYELESRTAVQLGDVVPYLADFLPSKPIVT
jgi:hypothetical protein